MQIPPLFPTLHYHKSSATAYLKRFSSSNEFTHRSGLPSVIRSAYEGERISTGKVLAYTQLLVGDSNNEVPQPPPFLHARTDDIRPSPVPWHGHIRTLLRTPDAIRTWPVANRSVPTSR